MKTLPKKPELHTGPYAAVEIWGGVLHCSGVRPMLGTIKLVSEAPLLPVRECDIRDVCRCRYRKLADRRSGRPNRRGFLRADVGPDGNRRATVSDRRQSDGDYEVY